MKYALLITAFLVYGLISVNNVFAATCSAAAPCPAGDTCIGGSCITNPVSTGTVQAPTTGVAAFWISRFFLFTLPIVGIIGFLFFLWSGFSFLMSRGDPKGLAAAKARLTYAIAGLIVVFIAYSLAQFISGLFGLVGP
jgi:Type IV secretion system pilin